ncbi:MAG TPA: MFS transporter [Anaeromyxobacteraceae bacterium]|nr:MFS transporter [Anaeromyxobacteraceae bacterium]
MDADRRVALRSPRGRGLLAATVLASGMAFLDGTVVNVALPTLARELATNVAGLQWVVDGYLLTLSAFLLLGGSVSDRVGGRRAFLWGTAAFAVTSGLCGLSPGMRSLVAARAVQGLAAALLVPVSLALLRTGVRDEDRDAAVGAWAGLTGVTSAAGPLLGGWLVEAFSWRWIFFLNLPVAAAAIATGWRCLPSPAPGGRGRLDLPGAALAAAGLGALVHALIEGPAHGFGPRALATGAAGAAALGAFVAWERRARHPMLPLGLFRRRQFTAVNATTLALYFALGSAMFVVVLGLQHGLGHGPVASSLALLPISAVMLVASPLAGRAAHRVGYRAPLVAGPALAAAGLALTAEVGFRGSGLAGVAASVVVFGLGLGITVAPLTAAALGAVEVGEAGVASAVNNAVARLAGLLGVALVPGAAGLSMEDGGEPFLRSVRGALLISAAICLVGGAISWLGLRPPRGAGRKGRDHVLRAPGPLSEASRKGGGAALARLRGMPPLR